MNKAESRLGRHAAPSFAIGAARSALNRYRRRKVWILTSLQQLDITVI